jgi:hypothetical protein
MYILEKNYAFFLRKQKLSSKSLRVRLITLDIIIKVFFSIDCTELFFVQG